MSRFFKTFLLILVILILSALIYFIFFSSKPAAPVNDNQNQEAILPISPDQPSAPSGNLGENILENNSSETPNANQVKEIFVVNDILIQETASSSLPQIIYARANDGKLERLTLGGSPTPIVEAETTGSINRLWWGREKDEHKLITRRLTENGEETILLQTITSAGDIINEPTPFTFNQLSIAPAQDQLFYLERSAEGVKGFITNWRLTPQTQIFSSPFRSWQVNWFNQDLISLTTRASSQANGFSYFLNPKTKGLTKVLGNLKGLSVLPSPDANYLLYSATSASGRPELALLNLKERNTVPLTQATLAEKCVWGSDASALWCAVPKELPAGDYPDSWYQGQVSFTDELWRYDLTTGEATLLDLPADLQNENFDAINLTLTPNNDYLFLINKLNSKLLTFPLINSF